MHLLLQCTQTWAITSGSLFSSRPMSTPCKWLSTNMRGMTLLIKPFIIKSLTKSRSASLIASAGKHQGSLLKKASSFYQHIKVLAREAITKASSSTDRAALIWWACLRVRGLPDRKTSLAGLVWEKTSDRMPADSLTSPMCVITSSSCPAKHLYKRDICALQKQLLAIALVS